MRIQHNIMAMNAYRNYNTNTSALSKNLEKLSSGYKINRAGDDAAGLAISEKMRAQITGLNAAQKNVKDGISLVKTAEGAMQEIQDMLNRMDYLATQSANGTYDDPVDRLNLQKEVNALRSEIDRIAESANFNGIPLLSGKQSVTAAEDASVTMSVNTVTSNVGAAAAGGTATIEDSKFTPATTAIDGLHPGTPVVNHVAPSFSIDISGVSLTGVTTDAGGDEITITIGNATITAAVSVANTGDELSGTALATAFNNVTVNIGSIEFTVSDLGNGKLGFQATNPSLTDGMATTINAEIEGAKVEVGSSVNTVGTKGDWIHGVQDVTKGADYVDGHLGGISLKLDQDIVRDGSTLTIGDQTFIFKVGANSATTQGGGAAHLIDLSNVTGDIYKAAADEIAKSSITITDANNNNTTFKVSAVDGATIHIDQQKATTGTDVNYDADMLKGLFGLSHKTTAETPATIELSGAAAAADVKDGDMVSLNGKTYTIGAAPEGAKNAEDYISAASFNALVADAATENLKKAAEEVLAGTSYAGQYTVTVAGGNVKIEATAGRNSDDAAKLTEITNAIQAKAGKVSLSKISADNVGKGGLNLQIGDTSDSFNQLSVKIGDMHTKSMGTMEEKVEGGQATPLAGKSIADIDISNIDGAHEAIDVIKNAINYVSGIRGDLGAVQNRLEHTANNLSVMAENIQDAESTIRDTDVAEEMMAYTKNNILVQSAQAMLAQANAVPQGVLQLLG